AYLVYLYHFFVTALRGDLIYTASFCFDLSHDSPITAYVWFFVFIMLSSALTFLFAISRLSAILLRSVLDFSMAVSFVLFSAPALALSQSIVETVTTVLFLLCFYFLPEWTKEETPVKSKITNGVISFLVGMVFIVVGLSVNSGKLYESISWF